MKFLCLLLGVPLLLTSCQPPRKNPDSAKAINITFHRTIETIMILRAISPDDYFLKRVPDTSRGRPMLYKARKYFARYKNHPAVAETQKILTEAEDIGGVLFQGVLYAEELPSTQLKAEPLEYWETHKDDLIKYMQVLGEFYKEANVAGFFEENKGFYEGAIAEAKSYISDSITSEMEEYFGKENESYNMYILPVCPYGWAFSATTAGMKGSALHAIISPVNDVSWKDSEKAFKEFGFGGKDAKQHYNQLVIHEYVHAFITDVIQRDSFKMQIARYDSLYTPMLDSVLNSQGYSSWWGFMNEHLVRLGHIRVAETMSKDEAIDLRRMNIVEDKFIFLPEAESLASDYEVNREKYKTIDSFLPALIDQFKNYNRSMVDARLRASASANN